MGQAAPTQTPSTGPLTRTLLDLVLTFAAAGLAVLIVAAAINGGEPRPGETDPLGRIRRDPLDLAALRDLGLRMDRQGRIAEADAIMSFVGRRTWRDGPAEVWLLRRRLGQGRLDEAFQAADALLRRDGTGALRPALFSVLIAAAGDVEARPPLEARLAEAPGWRADFLRALAARGDETGASIMYGALAAGRTPPSPQEYAPFIDRLVSEGRYREALNAWIGIARRAVAGVGDPRGPDPWDGNFARESDGTAFTWSAAEGVGAASEVLRSEDGSTGRILKVNYDGFSSPALPAQLLVLTPGRYRLAWRERIDPAAAAKLYWRLRCADSGRVVSRASLPSHVAGDRVVWREVEMDLDASATGCAAQWLELIASPGDRREPFTAWYAEFQLHPVTSYERADRSGKYPQVQPK